MASSDTIFALATASGRAGVSIIRMSGGDAQKIAEQLVGTIIQPRYAEFRTIKDPSTGEIIDKGLILFFNNGASFTGEEVVEFQCHGSLSVVDSILDILGQFERCRLAEPGEFTKRALLNGKMDLIQVEGLGDLIEAETVEQRRQANRVMDGDLRRKSHEWSKKLLKMNSLLEASIDFSDEELPDNLLNTLRDDVSDLITALDAEIAGFKGNEIIRNGFTVAIIGKPNVGKSTLLNKLAGREVAITSEISGTTRDVIEARLDLSGIPVTFLDTAGLHESDDTIEVIGIDRARQRAADADLRLFLLDDGRDADELDVIKTVDDLIVFSKSDLHARQGVLNISAKTGDGIGELTAHIENVLKRRVSSASSLVRRRHVDSVSASLFSLRAALELIETDDYDIELASELLRETVGHLDHLVGKFDIETVLGEIFSSFCIGK